MPGLTFSNELISRDEGTHTVSRYRKSPRSRAYFLLQDFACLVSVKHVHTPVQAVIIQNLTFSAVRPFAPSCRCR